MEINDFQSVLVAKIEEQIREDHGYLHIEASTLEYLINQKISKLADALLRELED